MDQSVNRRDFRASEPTPPRDGVAWTVAVLSQHHILKRMPEQVLRLYPTEAAAKKAGLQLACFDGPRLATVLYALLPAGEKKATCLLAAPTARPSLNDAGPKSVRPLSLNHRLLISAQLEVAFAALPDMLPCSSKGGSA
jgi:hypothetical protein